MNFSRRKIGHVHDNSTDSEHTAGARELNAHVHVQYIFSFENGQGNKSFFSVHAENTAETSEPQAPSTDD